MRDTEIIASGKRLFNTEIMALEITKNALDERFVDIVKLIVNCKGKVIITGMGKPGHIGIHSVWGKRGFYRDTSKGTDRGWHKVCGGWQCMCASGAGLCLYVR